MGKSNNYYAVAIGRKIGVYKTWNECKKQIDKFPNARFKKFGSFLEATAFIKQNSKISKNSAASSSQQKISHQKSEESPISRKRVSSQLKADVDAKKPKIESSEAESNVPVVYTDGACSKNGQKNARAGWGVYWGPDNKYNTSGPVHGEQTNNRGELMGVEKALEQAIEQNMKQIIVKTDSNLLIQSMEKWIKGWKRNGWKTSTGTSVKNRDLLENIDGLMRKIEVKFEHVRGHSGIEGNEKADELARQGAKESQI